MLPRHLLATTLAIVCWGTRRACGGQLVLTNPRGGYGAVAVGELFVFEVVDVSAVGGDSAAAAPPPPPPVVLVDGGEWFFDSNGT